VAAGRAVVREVVQGADDRAALAEAGEAGIDCPRGWPDAFVAFVAAHHGGVAPVPRGTADRGWRRPLTMRLTDLMVRQETRLVPLSRSADRIGHVATRCACLLAQLAQQGRRVDRGGSGTIVEVYSAGRH
jgi:hypothetical protein